MEMKLRTAILFCIVFFSNLLVSQTRSQAYLLYIDQYYQLAQKQQKEHGIPASIILAQGLLESGAGQSMLARTSNNHFGIKCAEWTGDKVFHDDDEKGECFRKYNQVLDSYEDHSLFLKNRSRYASLFELKPTDYEGWAHGLKKAGYATDPTYAYKLISLIDNYELHRYDLGQTATIKPDKQSTITTESSMGSIGSVSAFVTHKLSKINGIRCVVAMQGDTYSVIADEFNMSEKLLRKYNEVGQADELKPGLTVFLSAKKKKAAKEFENHIVQAGESMYDIAQKYGIQTVKLYDLNGMSYNQGATLGKALRLR